MEVELRQRLRGDAGVAGIVGNRIYWDERKERSSYPSLVLTMVDAERPQHMEGFTTFHPTEMQFSCFAKSKAEAIKLREAVIAAIAPPDILDDVEFLRAQDIRHRPRISNTSKQTIFFEIVEMTIHHT